METILIITLPLAFFLAWFLVEASIYMYQEITYTIKAFIRSMQEFWCDVKWRWKILKGR